jgi:hypothetical protein
VDCVFVPVVVIELVELGGVVLLVLEPALLTVMTEDPSQERQGRRCDGPVRS